MERAREKNPRSPQAGFCIRLWLSHSQREKHRSPDCCSVKNKDVLLAPMPARAIGESIRGFTCCRFSLGGKGSGWCRSEQSRNWCLPGKFRDHKTMRFRSPSLALVISTEMASTWAIVGTLLPFNFHKQLHTFYCDHKHRHKVTVPRELLQVCTWRFRDRAHCGSKRC